MRVLVVMVVGGGGRGPWQRYEDRSEPAGEGDSKGDIAKSVVATGKIQPITKVELKSKASGIVEKLYVDINQACDQGAGAGAA